MRITVNGTAHDLPDVDPQTPLLWVLRDNLQLTGTRYGCGKGLCGSCTVHMDGMPVRACQLPMSATEGRGITTIEGLSKDGDHPLQDAWREHQVPQCGFCQAGQLMSAAALLEQNPKPTDKDIDAAMTGNICRCGTYQRIRAAIHTAADAADSTDQGDSKEGQR
ncbi:MAG: (2Fe-2S)-binding protein [Planctomycetes bacterium]|nr:(2Fe-2S)-binding protein [Planctomycetota bacterium]MCP4772218.1 (2Fe-2S)-binding protein [Planctomycetota bacterium]MCP4861274.1 (2Fe-2S)-binding protein [Planctomycetota bacterium]